jgi:hypothetical protein
MAYSFGVTTACTTTTGGVLGLIQNLSDRDNVDVAEAKDQSGGTIEVNDYNSSKEASAELVLASTVTAPVAGTNILIGTVGYLLTSVETRETNTDYKRLSITAKRWTSTTGVISPTT